MAALRYVDPNVRRGRIYGLFVRIIATRAMTRVSRSKPWSAVMWKIDPHLLRLTRGRLGTGLIVPTALLETVGARSGLRRRNAVIYFHDGARVTIVASQAGRPENPNWFHNLRANPDVVLGGERFHAEIVQDRAARERLWQLADAVFPAFARYRASAGRSGREIPIVQLSHR
ncbi:MAG TPA: nitroreductase/quinone reductase family protein [Solirubrobacteraceae bacterium]|nr:nitroreductase/quinone reductase family protein [Solirubrobacteraceae bacterium]